MVGIKRIALLLTSLLPVFVECVPVLDKRTGAAIPNKYIVTLKPGTSAGAAANHLAWVNHVHSRRRSKRELSGVDKVYEMDNFKAYAGSFDEETVEEIKHRDDVR